MRKPNQPFEIRRDAVADYFYWSTILSLAVGLGAFMGLGLVLAALYAATVGRSYPRQAADELRYWLEDDVLRVDSGVWFLRRRAIPLNRVSDIVLSQGPLMRKLGIWALHVQTTGLAGQPYAAVMLLGLEDPEGVRDLLLAARAAHRPVVEQSWHS